MTLGLNCGSVRRPPVGMAERMLISEMDSWRCDKWTFRAEHLSDDL